MVKLSVDIHGSLGWRRAQGYGFARDISLVPIAAEELQALAQDIPVAFRKRGDQWQAVAVLGPMPEVNLQVQPNGLWRAGCVPGLFRSYPFQLSSDRRALGLWPDYLPETVIANGVEPFYVQQQLTPLLVTALAFLQDFHEAIDRFDQLISWLAASHLLQPWKVFDLTKKGRSAGHCDLFAVDHNALKSLTEADWFALHQLMPVATVLPLLHAHLSSLDHAKHFIRLAHNRNSHAKLRSIPNLQVARPRIGEDPTRLWY